MHEEKEKIKKCQTNYLMKFLMHTKIEDQQLKRKRIHIRWPSLIKHSPTLDGKIKWQELIH